MGKILRISKPRRREYENYLWSVTDPKTPVEHEGVIAQIFRIRKGARRRYVLFRGKKQKM